ncbi:sodium- and chloride-dependent creatine transporter 1 isoform X4 [Denticeps clupeoides]|uniref:sodium- and chloride-dependent creatine transporter 1 isoform X4 n=1 Tax=Denticeps clupeoides TaxID=299321 RepID=UPI0010A4BA90|nr:sodium- and chloride-dependent creatine transporter 1-like isoform X4 [Denticeps clupeoides]XP_028838232.1 sodium- and chloride-dependent creatine transporter 1-like isoform X4 [Denticeps clupeoides]
MAGEQNRVTWSRQIEFTLAGIGCAVGLGNVWRFPYLCYRSGGGAFLLPYLLMLVVLGIPLLYMELIVGQYLRRGPVQALAKVCPLLKGGVGLATVTISFIMCTYYNVIITWSLYYLFSSFQSPLPWHSCNNSWNQPNCTDHASNSSSSSYSSSTASQQFFNYKVLDRTGGVEQAGTLRWELLLLLLLAWILNYFCIFKGVKSTGKVVYFTALFPYIVLLALLINNVQLPGAMTGIRFYLVPEWEKLLSVEVWVNAAAQIFNSIGIGFGSLMAMSSYNSFNNDVLKDTLAIAVTNSATSILAGFVIFSAFGYMSHLQNVPVTDIAVDGPGLVFMVYPEAFVTMPVAPLWAILFFFMLLCLGLDIRHGGGDGYEFTGQFQRTAAEIPQTERTAGAGGLRRGLPAGDPSRHAVWDLRVPADGPLHSHRVHHVPCVLRNSCYLLGLWCEKTFRQSEGDDRKRSFHLL